ncbi:MULTISPECIES: hypothetical protein [Kitasatospora]|uniref:Uncharacterized protein n=1 Tax=Kitasatospora cystarginea TaxID=58350 RepID=A0ABN3E863_9ACTN
MEILLTGAAGRIDALLRTPDLGFEIVYGISANSRAWWDLGAARRLDYRLQGDAERYADAVLAAHGPLDPADPDARYGGGRFTVWSDSGDGVRRAGRAGLEGP